MSFKFKLVSSLSYLAEISFKSSFFFTQYINAEAHKLSQKSKPTRYNPVTAWLLHLKYSRQ